ncbi:MAG: Dabb family protein [Verrucomicrobia bacterium]|nr:Dabb family protein [Verrucomicrobiota bacterium]
MKPLLLIVILVISLLPMQSDASSAETREFDPAFTHVVYFWLKDPESAADRSKFEGAVKQFMHDSKYAKTRFIGVAPKASRGVVDDSFTYSLILSFESAQAQENYQAEAAHQAFVDACKDLWERVVVYDSIPLE